MKSADTEAANEFPPPVYTDDLVTLHLDNCLDVLQTLPDNSVDAVVTDPPYGLGARLILWDLNAVIASNKAQAEPR